MKYILKHLKPLCLLSFLIMSCLPWQLPPGPSGSASRCKAWTSLVRRCTSGSSCSSSGKTFWGEGDHNTKVS